MTAFLFNNKKKTVNSHAKNIIINVFDVKVLTYIFCILIKARQYKLCRFLPHVKICL